MANTKQARKRVRQNEERRQRNHHHKSRMRTAIKRVESAVANGDKSTAQTELGNAVSLIDRTASKGAIHKQQAARRKSRLSQKVQGLARPHLRPPGGHSAPTW